MAKRAITKKSENISDWYNEVILAADLADYGPAKGTMIIKPYGFGIWEHIKTALDTRFKENGVENAYFPLFIPESLLQKEKDHIEGFSPELAVVTIGGGEELTERLAVRPTSETIMYDAYSKWIQSWRDLPVVINQWNNVVRWEKRTYLFLRTSEFLWQEGHTTHATHEEARERQQWAMDTYQDVFKEHFALFGYAGYKSESERFAGADSTMTFEALMPSGKTLQNGTSHDLGQNFAKSFDITFQDKDGNESYVWQTSWGVSTRSIGGLILAHGDDNGLVLPPKLAPVQCVILPIRPDESETMEYANDLYEQLEAAGIRVKMDEDQQHSVGYRINQWELKGVPLRIEIGGNEVEDSTVTVVRRDNQEKTTLGLDEFVENAEEHLQTIQDALFEQSKQFTLDNTFEAADFDEFKEIMNTTKGFIKAPWCENAECEAKIKEETTAKTACLPFDAKEASGTCIHCDRKAKNVWLFAQAY